MALLGMENVNRTSDPDELATIAATILEMQQAFPKPYEAGEFNEFIEKLNVDHTYKLKFVSLPKCSLNFY